MGRDFLFNPNSFWNMISYEFLNKTAIMPSLFGPEFQTYIGDSLLESLEFLGFDNVHMTQRISAFRDLEIDLIIFVSIPMSKDSAKELQKLVYAVCKQFHPHDTQFNIEFRRVQAERGVGYV